MDPIVNAKRLEKAKKKVEISMDDTLACLLDYFVEKFHTSHDQLVKDIIRMELFNQLEGQIKGKNKPIRKGFNFEHYK